MALTVTNVDSFAQDVWGRHRIVIAEVTFDSSYALGGESFTPNDVGLSEFSIVIPSVDANGDKYAVNYDYTDQTLVILGVQQDADGSTTDPFDEEDDEADADGLVVRVLCVGH